MTSREAERLAALPPDQQRALLAEMTERVEAGWAKQWGALPKGQTA